MAHFGADIAPGLGEGLSGLAEVRAGELSGAFQREMLEQRIREANQRAELERGWQAIERERMGQKTTTPRAPTKLEQDLSLLKMVGALKEDGTLTPEGKRYLGLTADPKVNHQLVQHPGMVPYIVEESTDPDTGKFTVKKVDIQGAGMIPKTEREKKTGPGGLVGYLYDEGLLDTDDLIRIATQGKEKAPEPLKGEAAKTMTELNSSIEMGKRLVSMIDAKIKSDPRYKDAPTPEDALRDYKNKSTFSKLKDTAFAKLESAKYFGGRIPDDYTDIITQAEQFTRFAVPKLTGSRAARYNQAVSEHLPNAPKGDTIWTMREKLMIGLVNLAGERDEVIRTARTKIPEYLTTDELPSPSEVPHDGQVHVATSSSGKQVKVMYDEVLHRVVQVR